MRRAATSSFSICHQSTHVLHMHIIIIIIIYAETHHFTACAPVKFETVPAQLLSLVYVWIQFVTFLAFVLDKTYSSTESIPNPGFEVLGFESH